MEDLDQIGGWFGSWMCGLLLILICIAFHVFGLLLIHENLTPKLETAFGQWSRFIRMPLSIATLILLLTVLHGIEAFFWALAYLAVGAIPHLHGAILFSLGAITTYGNSDLDLVAHWRLLGALQALNGTLLFGLTTAFVFSALQRFWPAVNGV